MERSEAIEALADCVQTIRYGYVYSDNSAAADHTAEAVRTILEEREPEHKARFDRYVFARIASNDSAHYTEDQIAQHALDFMLAADKRWGEYTKGGQDAD